MSCAAAIIFLLLCYFAIFAFCEVLGDECLRGAVVVLKYYKDVAFHTDEESRRINSADCKLPDSEMLDMYVFSRYDSKRLSSVLRKLSPMFFLLLLVTRGAKFSGWPYTATIAHVVMTAAAAGSRI
jgi:hypothetical protein